MANLSPLSDFFGTYTHQLTASDLPQMSHNYYVNSSKVKSLLQDNKPEGYLCITPEFKISVNKKPHPKYLHNMKKSFGWTWENV